jgi:ATP-binding cassette subfamily B protein
MTQRLLWPLTSLGETLDLYQRSMASTDRALDLLDADALLPDGETTLDTNTVGGEIELENVSFEYQNTDNLAVIRNLSLRIPAGETIGIVGSTSPATGASTPSRRSTAMPSRRPATPSIAR